MRNEGTAFLGDTPAQKRIGALTRRLGGGDGHGVRDEGGPPRQFELRHKEHTHETPSLKTRSQYTNACAARRARIYGVQL